MGVRVSSKPMPFWLQLAIAILSATAILLGLIAALKSEVLGQ
jgi:hypothetical protein